MDLGFRALGNSHNCGPPTLGVYRGYLGIMETKMEATI